MSICKLALPSKGRLMENAAHWLGQRGITLTPAPNRAYCATIEGCEWVRPVFLSAGDIAFALADGQVDFGITGLDLVKENIPNWQSAMTQTALLDFGHADLVVAVPQFWHDVDTMHDFDAVCGEFRTEHGFRLRIATKYKNSARHFLKLHGVADYQIIPSQGATEGSIRNNIADAIIDITSSGATLRDNFLKTLSNGLILQSQALLLQSHKAQHKNAKMHARFAGFLGL